jgi:hypothetical protein
MNDHRADEQDDHPSMRWSRTFFVLTLSVWAFVLLESVSAAPLVPSEKQWYQDPQKVTVVLIGIYTLATIVYAFFAGQQWKAIRGQAQIAKEALITDKRAFVFATSLLYYWYNDPIPGLYNFRLRPQWQNSGDTPTKRMTLHAACEIRNTPLPPGFVFVETTTPGKGLLPPKTTLQGGIAPQHPQAAITPQDIVDAQAGRKFIYLWGWVKYFDVFSGTSEHVTRFCWLILVTGDPRTFIPNAPGAPPTPGTLTFSYLVHTEGNCADDECP